MAVLMFIDHVLRDKFSNAPIPAGSSLYKCLKEKHQVILIGKHKKRDEKWLRDANLYLIDDLIGDDIPFSAGDLEFRQVQHLRGQGPVEFVVTSDPELAERLLEAGVTTLMFLHPVYMSEKFRPDSPSGKPSWDSIREEIVRQQDAYLDDPRVQ